MKSLFASSIATVAATTMIALVLCGTATAQDAPAAAKMAPMDANEAAGLPNLDAINRPAERGAASAAVELNVPRTPSFHEKSPGGTEITEYRDHGKPTEIDVHSGMGTNYQMSSPTDTSPRINNDGPSQPSVPSIKLTY
jgi:hypothetical protein